MGENVYRQTGYTRNFLKLKDFFEMTTELEMVKAYGVLIEEYEDQRTYDFYTEERSSINGKIITWTQEGKVNTVTLEFPLVFNVPREQVPPQVILRVLTAIKDSCFKVFDLKKVYGPVYEGKDALIRWVGDIQKIVDKYPVDDEKIKQLRAGDGILYFAFLDQEECSWLMEVCVKRGYAIDEEEFESESNRVLMVEIRRCTSSKGEGFKDRLKLGAQGMES